MKPALGPSERISPGTGGSACTDCNGVLKLYQLQSGGFKLIPNLRVAPGSNASLLHIGWVSSLHLGGVSSLDIGTESVGSNIPISTRIMSAWPSELLHIAGGGGGRGRAYGPGGPGGAGGGGVSGVARDDHFVFVPRPDDASLAGGVSGIASTD